jgi:hypothetical protein
MDYDEYKNLLRAIKKNFGKDLGIKWNVPSLQPVPDVVSPDIIGWRLKWAGVFVADKHYICVREHWQGSSKDPISRQFFSYHYGPYIRLEGLDDARWKAVVARIDSVSYSGRGPHIHDNDKDKRIFQDQLTDPDLSQFDIPKFIECAIKTRRAQTVTQAFDLRFK